MYQQQMQSYDPLNNTPYQPMPTFKKEKKPYLFETFPLHLRLIGLFVIFPLYLYFLPNVLLIPVAKGVYRFFNWPSSEAFQIFFNILYQICTLIPLIILLHNVLLQSVHDLKKRGIGNFLAWLLLGYFAFFATTIVFGLIENLLVGSSITSQNQAGINDMVSGGALALVFASVFLAPVTEELLFRGILFRLIRPAGRIPAILASGFLFGFIHVSDYVFAGDFHELLYMISYVGMGLALSTIYELRRNLLTTICIHMLQNTLAITMSILLYGQVWVPFIH